MKLSPKTTGHLKIIFAIAISILPLILIYFIIAFLMGNLLGWRNLEAILNIALSILLFILGIKGIIEKKIPIVDMFAGKVGDASKKKNPNFYLIMILLYILLGMILLASVLTGYG